MYNPRGEGPGLNRFLLISVLLHALLFITLPNFYSPLETDYPGLAGGGVIQVMHVDTSSVSQLSPVTDRLSQATIPRVTEPKPLPERPQPEEAAVAQPQPPEIAEPRAEQSGAHQEEQPEPEESTGEESEAPAVEELPYVAGEGDLLTSELGEEIVVAEDSKDILEPSQPSSPAADEPISPSGTGEGFGGEDDESGISQSGTGTEEAAPPLPGPPPSGFSLHLGTGGNPVYPKNAENEEVEGTVIIAVRVSRGGQFEVDFVQRSGNKILDDYSENYVRTNWQTLDYDYIAYVELVFVKEESKFIARRDYDVEWLGEP